MCQTVKQQCNRQIPKAHHLQREVYPEMACERKSVYVATQMPSHCETIPPEEKWKEYRCREGAGEEQKEEGENKTKIESEKRGESHWKIYKG